MNIALVGLGMVAATHAKAIRALPDARLTGVMSRAPEKARQFAIDHCDPDDQPKVFTSVADLAAASDVDIVAICTPPDARADLVSKLATNGKHILMEKPIERSFRAARDIVNTCEAAKISLGVFLQHRMRESALALKALLDAGSLGKIALVEVSVPWWRPQAYYNEPGRGTYGRDGGGVLISQSIHTLDLMLALLGPVTRVQAMARTTDLHHMEAEDFVSAGLEFASGAVGSLTASTASFPGGAETITVHGTLGSAVLSPGALDISYQDGRRETIGQPVTSGGGADPMAFTHAWHQGIYQDFIDALAEGRAPAVTGRDALAVQLLIDTLVASSRQGRALDLPLSEHP
ncbi:Inositol 2-dehydrogenase [Shimia sp. SK013]|uniref:Gfo/Idh/MocA family protein n=1 Tax=Shimia sp. SK013 TaxID=1389006 RepID=UPI0006B47FF2|nr:Gfo/Idh/MocA family oxidoreductase [Shimia sp. SK013]KPA23209.1 Inositol 2-dehydrogenase [Shimia sp. SK013]